jgi:hypothetical protein
MAQLVAALAYGRNSLIWVIFAVLILGFGPLSAAPRPKDFPPAWAFHRF